MALLFCFCTTQRRALVHICYTIPTFIALRAVITLSLTLTTSSYRPSSFFIPTVCAGRRLHHHPRAMNMSATNHLSFVVVYSTSILTCILLSQNLSVLLLFMSLPWHCVSHCRKSSRVLCRTKYDKLVLFPSEITFSPTSLIAISLLFFTPSPPHDYCFPVINNHFVSLLSTINRLELAAIHCITSRLPFQCPLFSMLYSHFRHYARPFIWAQLPVYFQLTLNSSSSCPSFCFNEASFFLDISFTHPSAVDRKGALPPFYVLQCIAWFCFSSLSSAPCNAYKIPDC